MPSPTLIEALAALPDPRSPHGRIHPFSSIMAMVVLAMLQGRTSLTGISRFGRQHGKALAMVLGFRRIHTPSTSSLSRTLRRIDVVKLEAILAEWIRGRIDDRDFELISIDGKTLRGSRDGEVPGVHLVAAYASKVQAVLSQIRVDSKTNEHKAALQLLGILPIEGKTVIGDAAFCQRDIAEKIVDSGGHYIFFAKDNQPSLVSDIKAGFAFEDQARRLQAATSPYGRAAASRRCKPPGHQHRQGPRPRRTPHAADHDDTDQGSRLEGAQAGL